MAVCFPLTIAPQKPLKSVDIEDCDHVDCVRTGQLDVTLIRAPVGSGDDTSSQRSSVIPKVGFMRIFACMYVRTDACSRA
jgi:hypothetical protein